MKYFALFLIVVVVIIAASVFLTKEFNHNSIEKNAKLVEESKQKLLAIDSTFYREAVTNGTGKAFINFAAKDVIIMRQKQSPIIGKTSLEHLYQNKDTVKLPLKWKPVKVEVSPDGKLGYVFGNWELVEPGDSSKKKIIYGNYVTIWKMQPDGAWKYVFEGGTTTPPPDTVSSQ